MHSHITSQSDHLIHILPPKEGEYEPLNSPSLSKKSLSPIPSYTIENSVIKGSPDITSLRRDYVHSALRRQDLQADPIDQFHLWFDAATSCQDVVCARSL